MLFDHTPGRAMLLLFCLWSAYEDARNKSLPLCGLVFFFVLFLTANGLLALGGILFYKKVLLGPLPGLLLLALAKISPESVGEGDGYFFILMGLILGWQNNLWLVFYTFLLAALFSLVLMVCRPLRSGKGGRSGRKKKEMIPLLPFTLPVLCILMTAPMP